MLRGAVIRKACSDDAARLSLIGRETFVETFGHLYKREDLDAFLHEHHSVGVYSEFLADKACCAFIVEHDNAVVGYACVSPCHLPIEQTPENSGELLWFYLRSHMRGHGIGTRLLTVCLDWLEARFDHIYVSVYAENSGAQRLYERFGFEKKYEYHFMIGKHADPEWIMKRNPNAQKA